MAFIVSIGERWFPCPITEEDEKTMASLVKSGLKSKGKVRMQVDGSDPNVHIGGVSTSLASRINLLNGLGKNKTEVKDMPNSIGVADRSVVVFESR